MTQRVTVPTSTGDVSAILELPPGEARSPGIVILPEYWGLNEQILTTAKRWAEEGFVAIVPDLYHGTVATTAEEAAALMKALDRSTALAQIAATVEYLRGHARSTGKVAITGYCMGGALAFASAAHVRGLSAVVPFYGLPGELDASKIDAPIQAHFATQDDWATVAGAQAIKDAVTTPMELHVYDAKHAFCNERRPEVYNADAAEQSWGRAVSFVRAHTR